MLRWRLLLGVLLIGALVGLCWADFHASQPGVWLFPLVVLLSLLASQEVLNLTSAKGARPLAWVVYLGNLAIVASNWLTVWQPERFPTLAPVACALGMAILLAFAGEMRRYEGPGNVTVNLALAVFALCYVGVLLSFLVELRLLGKDVGMAALLSLVIIVKMSDTGAYTVGRLVGRHKLAPTLSPGKTIEGGLGGLAFAILGAWFSFTWMWTQLCGDRPAPSAIWWLTYAVLITVAGVIGDLAESLLKRDAGRKDSSTWMPGFGGVLDLLDSLLLSAPVAYACWVFAV
ncbi:MAG: phosphatidate cytidylyltransferase [Pirellulales bacterium]|nr:phosphatidate cytidylyltransferase [Pirellulales bacterium]